MTKYQAHLEAHRRWGTSGIAPGDRYGMTVLRRKNIEDRCEVGYHVRGGRTADGVLEHEVVVVGRGPTWDEAFADASRKSRTW